MFRVACEGESPDSSGGDGVGSVRLLAALGLWMLGIDKAVSSPGINPPDYGFLLCLHAFGFVRTFEVRSTVDDVL